MQFVAKSNDESLNFTKVTATNADFSANEKHNSLLNIYIFLFVKTIIWLLLYNSFILIINDCIENKSLVTHAVINALTYSIFFGNILIKKPRIAWVLPVYLQEKKKEQKWKKHK